MFVRQNRRKLNHRARRTATFWPVALPRPLLLVGVGLSYLVSLSALPRASAEEPPAAIQQASGTHQPAEPALFTEALKSRYAAQIRQRAPERRIATLRELSEFASTDAQRLILQYGLRDSQETVHEAAQDALLKGRGNRELEDYLLDQLRIELSTKRRTSPEYVERLVRTLGRFHTSHVIRELLALGDRLDKPSRDLFLEAILEGLDEGSAANDPQLVETLRELASAPRFQDELGLKRCVVQAAIGLRQKSAVEFLVGQLPSLDGELRHDSVQHLRRVTQQALGMEPAAWQKWWLKEGANFVFPDLQTLAGPKPEDAQGAPLYYYDIPIVARRLVFVLDTSRSMGAGGTVSRLEAAKRELIATIQKLPDDTLFNIVIFNSEVSPWQMHLRTASATNKAQAAAFVQAQKPNGKTATYDAIHAALAVDSGLEAIFFLSDGAPSEGTITQPDAVLAALRQQNRTRRLKIHTLGAFGGQQAAGPEGFMRKLAEQNYGQFRRLD